MRILQHDTAAVIIDVQERLFPHIAENDELEKKFGILLSGLKMLDIPLIFTEQYRKGLGETIPSVKAFTNHTIEKMTFSCCDHDDFMNSLQHTGKKNLIIAGIEAHVCVLQTVIDMIERGFRPVVIEDCISSRNMNDKHIAVERMRQEGARISTAESILFELTRTSGTPLFKEISRLVK